MPRARRLLAALAVAAVLGTTAGPAMAQNPGASTTADRATSGATVATSVTRAVVTANVQRVLQLRARIARAAYAKASRTALLKVARAQIGDPYIAGKAGPDAFDCGGFVQFVFDRALGMELNRTSWQQYRQVRKIKRKNAQPGDLVFFFEGGAHHVGIYVGNGKMIDAPRPGEKVRVSPITGSWWGRSFTGIGRLLPPV
jgi:cell wall-associated NlpC family hydrolase